MNESPGAVYLEARNEAHRLGDRRIGTEHLLLALLRDRECAAAVGRDASAVREALARVDTEALTAVGISVAGCQAPPLVSPAPGRLPLTPACKRAFLRSSQEARSRRQMRPRHLLLALLREEPPDPAATLLARLGVDGGTVRERLREADV